MSDSTDVMAGEDERPKDAEAWLKAMGVERQPIRVDPIAPDGSPTSGPAAAAATTAEAVPPPSPGSPDLRIVEESPVSGSLDEVTAKAVAYIRKATARTPMSQSRLAGKLADRDYPEVVIDRALERAEAEGLIDDLSFAAALVSEGRSNGHAERRLRDDLYKRGITREVIERVLADAPTVDPDAEAFQAAKERAESLSHLDSQVAYRRLVAWLARRGHAPSLAHKAARSVLWADRESRVVAER